MKKLKKEKILGVNICASPMKDIIRFASKKLRSKTQTVIFTPNPQILLKAQNSPTYQKELNSATINLPDGIGIVLASKLRKGKIKQRIGGIDFATKLLLIAEKQGYRVFLLGAKPNIANKAKRKLKKQYPALIICGTHHGYFKKNGKENDAVTKKISLANPDIIFVCLGAPTQEEWIIKNKNSLPNVKLFIGLGGSLDVFAGNVKRAPKLMQRLGLEWLYRTVKEPKRARIFWDIPVFLFKILKSKNKHTKRLSQLRKP